MTDQLKFIQVGDLCKDISENILRGDTVVHNKDAQPFKRFQHTASYFLFLSSQTENSREAESAAFIRGAHHADFTIHHLNQPLANR